MSSLGGGPTAWLGTTIRTRAANDETEISVVHAVLHVQCLTLASGKSKMALPSRSAVLCAELAIKAFEKRTRSFLRQRHRSGRGTVLFEWNYLRRFGSSWHLHTCFDTWTCAL